jgi:hypothetical protein
MFLTSLITLMSEERVGTTFQYFIASYIQVGSSVWESECLLQVVVVGVVMLCSDTALYGISTQIMT